MPIRKTPITQLELEGFAAKVHEAEEAGQGIEPLSAQEVRERMMMAKKVFADKLNNGELPDYMRNYNRLLKAGVPFRIALYITWVTIPTKYRWPETLEELATKLMGLTSDRAIYTWRGKYPYIDHMIADLQSEEFLEFRPGAIAAMGQVISEPTSRSTQERRLYYELMGDLEKKVSLSMPGMGVGKDVLAALDKVPTDKLLEMLGPELAGFVEQLKGKEKSGEEIASSEKSTPPRNDIEGVDAT
jgi:hypothetical protein